MLVTMTAFGPTLNALAPDGLAEAAPRAASALRPAPAPPQLSPAAADLLAEIRLHEGEALPEAPPLFKLTVAVGVAILAVGGWGVVDRLAAAARLLGWA